jgi:hypothetical protein
MALPVELRILIAGYALAYDEGIAFDWTNYTSGEEAGRLVKGGGTGGDIHPLGRVCRQLHEETKYIVYKVNPLRFPDVWVPEEPSPAVTSFPAATPFSESSRLRLRFTFGEIFRSTVNWEELKSRHKNGLDSWNLFRAIVETSVLAAIRHIQLDLGHKFITEGSEVDDGVSLWPSGKYYEFDWLAGELRESKHLKVDIFTHWPLDRPLPMVTLFMDEGRVLEQSVAILAGKGIERHWRFMPKKLSHDQLLELEDQLSAEEWALAQSWIENGL